MNYLKICNWDKWQSYRKDRGKPPWIKLHRELLRHPEWACLDDGQRGQLIVIWLLAADRDGQIPDDPKILQKIGLMNKTPNIKLFIEQGFIEHDVNVTSTRRQRGVNVTSTRRHVDRTELDTEADTDTDKTLMSGKPDDACHLLSFLNEKTGKKFKPVASNLDPIKARLKEYTRDEIQMVIANRCMTWERDEKMMQYLRPLTLFRASNFSSYYGELTI